MESKSPLSFKSSASCEQLPLFGNAYLQQFLSTESIKIRQKIMENLESMCKFSCRELGRRCADLIMIINRDHDIKQLAGKRIIIGREKPTKLDLEFIENYFGVVVQNVEEINIENDTYGTTSDTHKEYVVNFCSLNDLQLKIRDLEQKLQQMKTK